MGFPIPIFVIFCDNKDDREVNLCVDCFERPRVFHTSMVVSNVTVRAHGEAPVFHFCCGNCSQLCRLRGLTG